MRLIISKRNHRFAFGFIGFAALIHELKLLMTAHVIRLRRGVATIGSCCNRKKCGSLTRVIVYDILIK